MTKEFFKQVAKPGFMLIIVAALTLGVSSFIQSYFSVKGIKNGAMLRAEGQLEFDCLRIMDVVNQAEAAVRNSVWIASWCLNVPDSQQVVARRVVEDNPIVVGSTLALVPGYDPEHPLSAPYACREGDKIVIKSLATEEYDYPSQEWFAKAIEAGEGYWSEPYIDEGGGNILMTTYSVPIKDKNGQIAAVLTADLSLDWLAQLANNILVYDNAYCVVLSRQGKMMVGPENEDKNQNENEKVQTYTTKVERTGWTLSIVIPDDEIFGGIRRVVGMVTILQLLGIGMLILILRFVAKNQMKYNEYFHMVRIF